MCTASDRATKEGMPTVRLPAAVFGGLKVSVPFTSPSLRATATRLCSRSTSPRRSPASSPQAETAVRSGEDQRLPTGAEGGSQRRHLLGGGDLPLVVALGPGALERAPRAGDEPGVDGADHVYVVADDAEQAAEYLCREWSSDRRQRWVFDIDEPAQPGDGVRPGLVPRVAAVIRLARRRAERDAVAAMAPEANERLDALEASLRLQRVEVDAPERQRGLGLD